MRALISQKEIQYGVGEGVEIKIEGCIGDTQEEAPGTVIFIEKYEGDVRVLVWNDSGDPQIIVIKQIPKK